MFLNKVSFHKSDLITKPCKVNLENATWSQIHLQPLARKQINKTENYKCQLKLFLPFYSQSRITGFVLAVRLNSGISTNKDLQLNHLNLMDPWQVRNPNSAQCNVISIQQHRLSPHLQPALKE